MIQVLIASADKTDFVQLGSLRIDNVLTQQVDRCTFKTRSFGVKQYIPQPGRIIQVTDGGVTVFGGMIVKVTKNTIANNIVEYTVECVDYTRMLDQHLVAKVYQNMTINAIVADIIATFCPTGITGTQVAAPQVVSFIQFNYEPVSSCLKQLADLVGYDWYIDYTKDIYFKAPETTDASIQITDTPSGEYDMDSVIIRDDNSQVRNSIVVRGGEYLGDQFTASAKFADPNAITFPLPYQYSDFMIRVNGVKQHLGIDYIDDPASYDALYNFNEKLVRWRTDNKPALNSTLSFSGKPYLPVIVRFKNQTLINAMFSAEGVGDGRYEFLVIDKSINSKQGARDRAIAEIQAYGETLSEGEFTTETTGLRAGQRILINSAIRGINDYYLINKVTSTMKTASTMQYKVSLVTTRTMDYISVLKKILLQETKKLEILANETIDLVEGTDEEINITETFLASMAHNSEPETITITESFTNNGLNFGTQFVLGPQTPSSTKRQFVLDGSRLG